MSFTKQGSGYRPFGGFQGSAQTLGGFAPSPGWQPVQLGGCVVEHASDQGATLVSTKISALADLSGSGHTASQGTDANRPTYQANASGQWPAARFTAASSNCMSYSAWNHPNPAATVFSVLKMQAAPSTIQALILTDSTAPRIYACVGATGRAGVHWNGAFRADTGVALDTAIHLLRWEYQASETRAAQDSTADGTGTADTLYGTWSQLGSRTGPGSDQFLNADLFRLSAFSRILSASEQALYKGFSRFKYGVPA